MPDNLSLAASAALIVSAFARNNRLNASDMPSILASVHTSLVAADGPPPVEPQAPAANLRRLVTPDAITCAECGKKLRSIKRHLRMAHGLTPEAYIAKWGLKSDHLMVAPTYTAIRSNAAKARGFGRRPASPPVTPTPTKVMGKGAAKTLAATGKRAAPTTSGTGKSAAQSS